MLQRCREPVILRTLRFASRCLGTPTIGSLQRRYLSCEIRARVDARNRLLALSGRARRTAGVYPACTSATVVDLDSARQVAVAQ